MFIHNTITQSVKGPLPAVSMATGFQTPAQGRSDAERRVEEAPARTHLAKGALSQDFAELELSWVGLLGPLLHVVRDVDLLDWHVILQIPQCHY